MQQQGTEHVLLKGRPGTCSCVQRLERMAMVVVVLLVFALILLASILWKMSHPRDTADMCQCSEDPRGMSSLVAPLSMFTDVSSGAAHMLVVYASEDGHTQKLGNVIAAGAVTVLGSESVMCKSVSEATFADVLWADAVVLGSPTYNAAVHPSMQEFINSWPLRGDGAKLHGKVGGSFVTSGGVTAGHELVLASLHASLQIFGFLIAAGPSWVTAFGAYAVDGEPAATILGYNQSYFSAIGEKYGQEVAGLASKLRK